MRQRSRLACGIGALPVLAGLLLVACSPGSDAPGALSADEAQQLNDAADMLDANSVDLAATNESR